MRFERMKIQMEEDRNHDAKARSRCCDFITQRSWLSAFPSLHCSPFSMCTDCPPDSMPAAFFRAGLERKLDC